MVAAAGPTAIHCVEVATRFSPLAVSPVCLSHTLTLSHTHTHYIVLCHLSISLLFTLLPALLHVQLTTASAVYQAVQRPQGSPG